MKVFNLLTACAIAAPLLFVSCNSDDIITPPDSDADGVRISFSLGVTAGPADVASRAADGELYDKGLDGENAVNNAMIVIYDRPINSAEDGKIVKVFYVDSQLKNADFTSTDATYFDPTASLYPQSDVLNSISVGTKGITKGYHADIEIQRDQEMPFEVGKRYYAIALCNFEDMSKTFEGKSLKDFRDYVYTGALYNASDNIKTYSNFRMTGINETSFIWQRNNNKEKVDLGDFMVQRLAARVDVSFGATDYLNQGRFKEDPYIKLAVYTKNESTGKYEYDSNANLNFYLTDLQIVNAVNTGTYLIERSSPHAPTYRDESGKAPVPVYLDNEGWESYADFQKRRATKYIFCPSGKGYKTEPYSLVGESNYDDIGKLIGGGTFWVDEEYWDKNTLSENKRNSSLVGYIPENTCSENHFTMLRIVGKTNATTTDIFTQSRADGDWGDENLKNVVGDIPIMHNTNASSHVMQYAVVRNTIYRLHIKIYANNNKIYFRYYYCGLNEDANSSNQKVYQVAAFDSKVDDNYSDNPTIND